MQTRIIHTLFYDLETELVFYRTKSIKTAFMNKSTTEQNLLKQPLCIMEKENNLHETDNN